MSRACQSSFHHAFSLVELSIVLVILGLLTGGILTGQTLIHSAELRSASTAVSRMHTAFYAFRDKYFAMPGDMTNATQFWGAADGGDGINADCYAIESTDATTCNGNGNGEIRMPVNVTAGNVNEFSEAFRAWQHLANAGLVEGSYTGRTDSTTVSTALTVGKNAPSGRIGNSSMFFLWIPSNDGVYFPGVDYDTNVITVGLRNIITPADAYSMDVKVDDGSPAYGKVIAPRSSSGFALNCATSDDPATAEYNVSLTNNVCSHTVRLR